MILRVLVIRQHNSQVLPHGMMISLLERSAVSYTRDQVIWTEFVRLYGIMIHTSYLTITITTYRNQHTVSPYILMMVLKF